MLIYADRLTDSTNILIQKGSHTSADKDRLTNKQRQTSVLTDIYTLINRDTRIERHTESQRVTAIQTLTKDYRLGHVDRHRQTH